jgi:tetratricopeptide (TPR) repeat protein
MKQKIFFSLFVFIGLNSFGQSLKTVTLIDQRRYYLNGGTRALYGGISRETIKIDLPENTKSWYYSFTTSPGQDGTQLLNLGIQLSAALYSGLPNPLLSSIKVPKGSGSADVFVIPNTSKDAFLNKEEGKWRIYQDISLQNTMQAVQYVDKKYGNSLYLGLRNPSALTGIGISIEVVAIVEEPNPESDKGVMYGNLGWAAFEKGEFDKCLELSNKALAFDPNLSYVKFNIALVHLLQRMDECLDNYIDAISSVKNDKNPKQTLLGALEDVRNERIKNPYLESSTDIETLLVNELKKYR